MLQLICSECGNYIYLHSIQDFYQCQCGAMLTKDTIELIFGVENCIQEVNFNIRKRNGEGLASKFEIVYF